MVSTAVGAYVNYHTNASLGNESNPTMPVNSPITEENNTTATPQPSLTPTPSQTNQPVTSTSPAPLITPAPTSLLPDDCRINYQEYTTSPRSYDKDANTTQMVLYVVVISDISSRGTYTLYLNNFYLKENGLVISILNTNVTGQGEGILVNEDNTQTAYITVKVAGNYTSGNYELAYYNFPDLLVNWKKIT